MTRSSGSRSESSPRRRNRKAVERETPSAGPMPAADGRPRPSSPTLLQHIIDALADGVVVAGLDGRLLLFNPMAERLLGMTPAEVPSEDWTSVYGCYLPDMVTPCPTADLPLLRALRGEVVRDFTLFLRNRNTPDGVWLSVSGTPLRDSAGTIEGGVVVLRDVTAQKREFQKNELLSNVVEQTADSVIITDKDGKIEYVNPAFEKTTGYSRAEVLGGSPRILKSGVHGRQFYIDLWSTLVAGHVFRGTITDRKKSGALYLSEQTITPMRGSGGGITHLVSVAKDVTELRKAAERDSKLLLARSVQQRLYPASPPHVPGFDISGAAFVADVTGGDYFDFVPLSGQCLGIVVGDVSGHGFDSALLMAETRAVLRSTAQTISEPNEILSIVNRVLAADTEENRFTTLLVARLHPPTRMLTYASAGHTPGYVLDGSGAVKRELTATGLPLGLFPDAAFETGAALVLDPGDTLVLFTDGVTESEAPDGTFFGAERALEVVRFHWSERCSAIVQRLYHAARAFEQGAPQRDDVTAVLCRAERAG